MGRKKTDLHKKIIELLDHTEDPPEESAAPLKHFERSVNDTLAALRYIEDHVTAMSIYLAVFDQHMSLIRRLALGSLVQAFERFIKELAVVCVDHISGYVHDDRLDEFKPGGSSVAINFSSAGSIGRLLCEADTWMNTDAINKRFRQTLKSEHEDTWQGFIFLREKQNEGGTKALGEAEKKAKRAADEQRRAETVSTEILWQVRHTITHNVGLLTRSDARKLRLVAKKLIAHDRVLSPTEDDLRHVKQILRQIAHSINDRVGKRLAQLLTEFHAGDPTLFDAQQAANQVSKQFAFALTVSGSAGVP